MVAHLVRLKLALVANGLRRSVWQVVGFAFAVLYGLGILAIVVAGMVAVGTQDVALQRTVTVLVGSALVIGWWFIPLLAFGVDATLDPERFATFAIPRRVLVVGLAVAALVGVPGVLSAVAALSTSLAWFRHPGALLVGVVAAVLGLAVAVVGGRAVVALAAPLVARRRARELTAVVTLLLVVSIGPTLGTLTNGREISRETFDDLVGVLAWTPFGAAWAAPADVAAGDPALAVARLAIAGVTLAIALRLWEGALARTLVQPVHAGSGGARPAGLGVLSRVPATPLGAVVGRCLVYWFRDPRYAVALAIVPFTPVILWVVGRGGNADLVLASGVLAAFVCGWGVSSDVSYDGSAFWMHVSAGVRGVVDRLGRVVASGIIAVPLVTTIVVVTAAVTDRLDAVPALLGAAAGVMLTSYGGASIVSALFVQPVQQPGENPFQTRQGASMATVLSQTAGWALVLVAASPPALLAWFAVSRSSAALGWAALALGVVLGAVWLTVGVRVGGRLLDRRAPVLLQRVIAFE
ncbi:hypothetical protein [Cellulomonas sp. PSBB021]|uniref:hypothetical protein n=1 Tax=Cellulomonas sp. PSBB021 TaxID=2003551 RepID=UPI000B8D9221|nr:hypothetical protein [Cellulomonas sp. PSBB021]ASR53840.1 hypothetical protein CBP52_00225 [Cellulomonas sp. PSBB021]